MCKKVPTKLLEQYGQQTNQMDEWIDGNDRCLVNFLQRNNVSHIRNYEAGIISITLLRGAIGLNMPLHFHLAIPSLILVLQERAD
jgi:hypothetical protein